MRQQYQVFTMSAAGETAIPTQVAAKDIAQAMHGNSFIA
jgi:hypothetical protein